MGGQRPKSLHLGAEEMYKDNSQLRIEDFIFPYGSTARQGGSYFSSPGQRKTEREARKAGRPSGSPYQRISRSGRYGEIYWGGL